MKKHQLSVFTQGKVATITTTATLSWFLSHLSHYLILQTSEYCCCVSGLTEKVLLGLGVGGEGLFGDLDCKPSEETETQYSSGCGACKLCLHHLLSLLWSHRSSCFFCSITPSRIWTVVKSFIQLCLIPLSGVRGWTQFISDAAAVTSIQIWTLFWWLYMSVWLDLNLN